jgi:hypothetical protein
MYGFRYRGPLRLVTTAGAGLFILGISACDGLAADWYPEECRRRSHCAEVDDAAYARAETASAETLLTVTTKHGTAVVPRLLPTRPSVDEAIHACMRVEQEGMQLTCLFVPPPRRE